ncbi:MAG: ABC transporter permease [Limisphaerales bacterium]
MNPLPLLSRELYVASRRAMTQRLRMGFAGGSMGVAVWALLVTTGTAGPTVFVTMAVVAATLSIFAAIFIASDTISRERREGTLGFLFLTDLHARDVVLGKLGAAGLVPMFTLLAIFPAFALCQLVGGVPAGLFWRMILALMVTLFFSLSATIFVSTFCEDHRMAYSGSTLLLLIANPLWICFAALTQGWGRFALAAGGFLFLALLFLRLSATCLGSTWRELPKMGRTTKEEGSRIKVPAGWLENFPVAWMMLRRQTGSFTLRAAGFCVAGFAALLCTPVATTAPGAKQALWVLFAVHICYQFALIARTAYSFYTDRQNGGLELLLGSRLENEEIFAGFNRFLFWKSAPLVSFLTAVDAVYAGVIWTSLETPMAVLPLGLAIGIWITLFGLGWLGVYRSLMMKHPSLAMLATFSRLSFVPVVLSLLFLLVPQSDPMKVAVFYVFTSGFLAVFFSVDAKAALAEHGRTLLLRPYSEKPPHIENVWSFIDWEESREAGIEGALLSGQRGQYQ